MYNTNHSHIQCASSTATRTKCRFIVELVNTFRHGCVMANSGDMKTANQQNCLILLHKLLALMIKQTKAIGAFRYIFDSVNSRFTSSYSTYAQLGKLCDLVYYKKINV